MNYFISLQGKNVGGKHEWNVFTEWMIECESLIHGIVAVAKSIKCKRSIYSVPWDTMRRTLAKCLSSSEKWEKCSQEP